MLVGETISVAFSSIRANKLRSVLTMLGIIIGVGAVIVVVSLGTGAQKAVEERITALGANLLQIYPGQSFQGGRASEQRVSMTVDDAEALRRDARLLSGVVPEMRRSLQIKYGSQNLNVNVTGTTANYATVRNFKVQYGRMFTQGDDESRQRYAVVGSQVPELLNVNAAALIGQTLQIRGIPFEVVGVLEKKGSQGFFNPDEQILIPLQTARYRVFGTDRLNQISVQVATNVPVEQAMVDIERIMRREHKIRPGADNDFQIRNQQDILATQQAATQVFSVLLLSVAAVSLVVGGIGIMNIMLVTVTERTKEIGIRKALGATRWNILLQFLIEAIVLCLGGGLLGVLLGTATSLYMAANAGWNTEISVASILISFGFAAGVGLFFGLWPAKRAASLDPIIALRYE